MSADRERPTAFILTHESDPQRIRPSLSIIALTLTRALGRRRVRVVRVHPNRLDRSLGSRYCSAIELCPDFYASEKSLLAFLLAMRRRYPGDAVLIPASDDCAWFVAKYHALLSTSFAVMAPTWNTMEKLIDKRRQYEQAAALGIPIPETYFPADGDEVRQLAAGLAHYPYVIKPLVAHHWRLAAQRAVVKGRKGFAADGPEELVARYEAVAEAGREVMIQEVIGGADQRLFTFLAYFDERARPVCYCIRKKVRQFPTDFGYCTMTVSCHDPVVEEQSVRLLRAIGYHGICGVEWKLDERSGTYKLIEINPRAVNTIGLGAACGVDIPYLAFRAKLAGIGAGDAEPVPPPWRDGAGWVNLLDDVWPARQLHREGKLSLADWLRSITAIRTDAVFAGDDLRPFAGYLGEFLRGLWHGRRDRLRQPPSSARALPLKAGH